MIENIRKYNIVIIIGLVVVAAALVIGLQTGSMGGPGGAPYIKVGARTYTDTEYRQLGMNGREIVDNLAQSGDFQRMYQFLFSLAPDSMFAASPEDSTEQFFINRMLIRQAKANYGVHPSDDQIDEYTRSLTAFRGANQEFDPEKYARFIKDGLGRMSMSEHHFRDLISDMIATSHLRSIISSGLQANPQVVSTRFALDQQKISGSVGRLELAPFIESIEPSDQQLQEYWEVIQDAFKTEEQRRFSYILVGPDPVKEEASIEQDKEPTLAEAAMTDEQKAAAAKQKAEKEAAKAAKLADAKREAQRKIDSLVDDFTFRLEEADGEGFEKLAAEEDDQKQKPKWEVKTTELFDSSNPPKELDLKLRSNTRGGNAVQQLFRITTTSDPLSKFSQPMAVGEGQWLVARLDERVPSETMTYEQASDQVREQYINEKAAEALKKAMDEAVANIATALKEGKSFTDASVDAGLTKVEPFADTGPTSRPANLIFPNNLFQLARAINPGKISETIVQGDYAYLIYVAKREIDEGVNSKEALANQLRISADQNAMHTFADWLKLQTEGANVERLYVSQ